jgi:hypothetical protein
MFNMSVTPSFTFQLPNTAMKEHNHIPGEERILQLVELYFAERRI